MSQGARWVLIVEDDEAIRETLTEILRDAGYAVDSDANGRQALERLRSGDTMPGLILLDLMMPVMDGIEFCAEKNKEPALRDIPVAIMSADGRSETLIPNAQVKAYLRKPMSIETILALVERYCA